MLNYENLEFLVEHGADPSIKDNDGRSPITLVGLLPKPYSIFSKAYCIESYNKRQQAKSEGKIFKCFIAVDSLVLKKDVRSVVFLIIAVVNAKSCIENLIRRFVRGTRKVKLKLK